MSRCLRGVPGLALVAALVLPCAAQAAQKDVSLGPPVSAQKALQKTGSDVNDFFPHEVRIHVGDKVRFVPNGFHTVDLPGRRSRKLPLITPAVQRISGSVDAAGAPFWFNGQAALGFNRLLLTSAFGKSRNYDGSKAVLSGLPLAQRPKPMTVKFNKTGTFRYFCDIHPGMTGIARVVSSQSSVPSAAQDQRTVRRQAASTLATAKTLARTPPPGNNTVDVGEQAKGNVELLRLHPERPDRPDRNRRDVPDERVDRDPHGDDRPRQSRERADSPTSGRSQQVSSRRCSTRAAVFPSDPPGALAALTPAFHGNGFWNSGALDKDSTTTNRRRRRTRCSSPPRGRTSSTA